MQKIIKLSNFLREFSILAIVFLVPVYFAFSQETYDFFILNKQVIFHILLALGWISQLVIFISQSKNFKFPVPNFKFQISNFQSQIFLLLFLLLLSFIISTIFSLHPNQSLWGSYARQEGLYSFLNYLLFFVLVTLYLQNNWQANPKRLIAAMIATSFVVSFYGILQYLGLDFFTWENRSLTLQRVVSTIGQPNFLGHYLIMVIPFTLWGMFFIAKKFLTKFLFCLIIIMQLICLWITYSRAAWLGFIVGTAVFFAMTLYFKKSFFKKLNNYKILIIFFTLIILFFLNINLDFSYRLKSIINFETGSNKVRMLTWGAAIEELKNADWQRLLFGYGAETQHSIFAKHYTPEWGIHETINTYPDRAHNNVLDNLLQFGLLYCLFAALLYGYIVFYSLKQLRKPEINKQEYYLIITGIVILVSYFINNLFSFSLVVTSVYFYLTLAILVFILKNKENITQIQYIQQNQHNLLRVMCYVLCIGYLLYIFFYDIKTIKADYYYMQADKARLENNCKLTLKNIEKSIGLTPRNTFYKQGYIMRSANCLENFKNSQKRHELSQKIIKIINAIPPQEYAIQTLNIFARAYALLGVFINPEYFKAANNMYQEIIKINPYFTTVYRDLAKLKLWQKKYSQALINLDQFFKVLPNIDHHHLNNEHRSQIEEEALIAYKISGDIFMAQKKYTKAINFYKMALKIDPYNIELYQKTSAAYQALGDFDKSL